MPLESLNLARGANTKEKEAFQATPDELRAIHEKMKDPVFVDLMKDYMTSLADPETRKEEEAYLEQAEREAREGGDYSYQFVFPRPAFVVELVKPTTTRISAEEVKRVAGSKHALPSSVRTYLNICTSDKIDEFREETTGNRMGSNWHVPVSVSARRTEFFVPNNSTSAPSASSNGGGGGGGDDDGGSNTAANIASPPSNAPLCYVHDAVFHPKTAALADRSDRFLCFLVEIAVEHLNNGYKESHGFEFSRLSSSITSIGLPKNQTIRSTNGKNPFAVDPNAPVLTKPTKHLDAAVPPSPSPPPPATTQKKKKEAEVEPSTTPDAQHRLPPFTITHRGHIDITDAWQWKVADRRVGVPEELVVRLTFNEIRKASALDVCITEDGGALQVERSEAQKLYEGLIVLPFTVEQSPTSARFDPATHVLTLVLRVVPPPAPEGAISAEELRRELHGPAITPLKEEEEAKEASSADAAPVKEAAAGVPTTTPAPTTATSTSTSATSEAVKEAVAAAPAPMKEAVVAAPVPDATTTAAAPVKEAAPSATTTTAEVGAPVVDHISDASRVQAMMAQVMEARKAREAAAAIISTKSPSVQSATPPLPSTPPAEEVEVAAAPSPNPCDGTGVQPSVTEPESIPFIKKARSEAEVEEEAALVARQKAWQEMMAAQMEEMAAVEAKAVERAQQKAARQSAQAARRLAEEKELEKLEMRARAKMEALPLRNKYLFAID